MPNELDRCMEDLTAAVERVIQNLNTKKELQAN
jgi:hypothetical protein